MNQTQEINRLRLACRRGMWELDLLFEPFLEHGYHHLSSEEKETFEELLLEDDPNLFAWFMDVELPSNPAFVPLIQKIKMYVKHSSYSS